MITILDLIIITIGTGIIGDTTTTGDGTITGTIVALIFMMGLIITIIIIVSLILQLYLEIMGEEEKR